MKFNQVVALLNTTFPRIPSRHRKGNLQQYAFHIQMWKANFLAATVWIRNMFFGFVFDGIYTFLNDSYQNTLQFKREQLITQCRRSASLCERSNRCHWIACHLFSWPPDSSLFMKLIPVYPKTMWFSALSFSSAPASPASQLMLIS